MKLTCRRVTELAYDFVANELTAEVTDQVKLHLVDCRCCVTLIETYRITISLPRKLAPQPMPEGLKARFMQAVDEWQKTTPQRSTAP